MAERFADDTAAVDDGIAFHCTACGKCCNTPPAMTIDELFHHDRLFIGSLAIGKIRRLAAGSRIPAGDAFHVLDESEARGLHALQSALFYDPGPQRGGAFVYSLTTQGFDYASLARCPALSLDSRCIVHDNRKPAICGVVPLDPHLPDSLQGSVLSNRMKASAFMGADCITQASSRPVQPLIWHKQIVHQGFAADLKRRRTDMAEEKRRWGASVFALLRSELFDNPAELQRIPEDGYLSLSLAPVLAVLARDGEAMRHRCVEYIDRQLELIDVALAKALARKRHEDRPTTAQLRAFSRTYSEQRKALAAAAHRHV